MKRTERFYFAVMVTGILCFVLTFSPHVFAADKNPCTDDIAKFCKNVKPGNNGIIRCLEKHEKELSQACRNYEMKMEGLKGERREIAKIKMKFRYDCKADIAKFCKDADLQKGSIAECIYKHEKKVSATCKEWIKADKEESGKTK